MDVPSSGRSSGLFWVDADVCRRAPQMMRQRSNGPNNRLERSRAASSMSQGGGSMIGIKYLRLALAKPRVAQPHR
jgi:hypothetical protein